MTGVMGADLVAPDAFDALAPDVREALEDAVELIADVARSDAGIGALEGSVKWGQPSIATRPKTGTPIRLGAVKSGEAALFVQCTTTLVADWASADLRFEGSRAVLLEGADPVALRGFVRAALTYHIHK